MIIEFLFRVLFAEQFELGNNFNCHSFIVYEFSCSGGYIFAQL